MMFKIGDILMLEPKYTPHKEKFNCMVVEMGTGCFYTDFPIDVETGKIAFLMDGTQFNVTFSNEEQAVYVFESEVLGKVKGRIPMMQLLLPEAETFVKIQRRQFVRLDVTLDTAIHPEHSEFTPFRTLTEDISAGGASIRLLNGTAIQSVSQLYLWMALTLKSGEIHYLRLKSKVIRVTEKEHGNMLLHVQFLEPSKNDIQTLMRFIFEKQVDLKKKGLHV
ncbi:flagellar brake protein [Peribacillus frigoritolerans]|jgi:c-di-GMP-binding flagellar brake protein YcgR|uniref:flagellar brake protein n=1 Tax=Peribacillus frigoritolerans TaxID=450367 RepID=UPI00207A4895|nr:flagellar brake domain-containing protein [Peribacillus frigoritolerans]USK73268.1 PilZ domain-containing protein [Peribacillus frigoritolerans]